MSLRLLGVPSAAGVSGNGVALASAALRDAGLLEASRERGVSMTDAGDLPFVPFAPDSTKPRKQNLSTVVEVARGVAAQVAAIGTRWRHPIRAWGQLPFRLPCSDAGSAHIRDNETKRGSGEWTRG